MHSNYVIIRDYLKNIEPYNIEIEKHIVIKMLSRYT